MPSISPRDHHDVEAEWPVAARRAVWDPAILSSAEERFGREYLSQRILIFEAKLARIRLSLKAAIDLASSLDLAARTLLPDAADLGFANLMASCRHALRIRPSDRRAVGLAAVELAGSIGDALALIGPFPEGARA